MRSAPIIGVAAFTALIASALLVADADRAADAARANPDVTISVTFPREQHLFRGGTDAGLVRARCEVCHSSNYVYTQPPLTKAQWVTEVEKMRKVYGATFIKASDVQPIADYLVTQNGRP